MKTGSGVAVSSPRDLELYAVTMASLLDAEADTLAGLRARVPKQVEALLTAKGAPARRAGDLAGQVMHELAVAEEQVVTAQRTMDRLGTAANAVIDELRVRASGLREPVEVNGYSITG